MKPDGQSPPPSAQWFPFSFSNTRLTEKISIWLDRHLFGGGPGKAGIEVGADEIRIRGVADFRLDIPRASVRSVARSQFQTRGWLGVGEVSRGRWLVNGSADGLVEVVIDPPEYTGRAVGNPLRKPRVDSVILSLADPDGFIAAVQPGASNPQPGSRK